MARREHQEGKVQKEKNSPRPYWYIRYRVRVLNHETGNFRRLEKRHQDLAGEHSAD